MSFLFNLNRLHNTEKKEPELFVYNVHYRWNKLALKQDECQLLLLKGIRLAPEVYHCAYRFCSFLSIVDDWFSL